MTGAQPDAVELNPDQTAALRQYLLAFADDEHLMGQHHTEWIGIAPFLEEDLALSSIGQDELGHAVMLYEQVLGLDGLEPSDANIDRLAYRRAAEEYRSCALVEYPAPDWAETLVRHWIYDTVEELRWSLLTQSDLRPLREIAARAEREEVYHRRHADALLDVLLQSTTGRDPVVAALNVVLPLLPSLVAPTEAEGAVVSAGVASATLASHRSVIDQRILHRFELDSLDLGPVEAAAPSREGRTEYFAPMMARMLEVLDYDPEATW